MIRDSSGESSFSVSIDISEEIKNQIREYALSDLTRELGGVLVGNVTQSGDTYSVTVTDYIIAKRAVLYNCFITRCQQNGIGRNKR